MTDAACDLLQVRTGLDLCAKASGLQQAEAGLELVAQGLRMPLIVWAPDIGRPHFDAQMHAFMLRCGWPDDILALWWDRHIMLKMPLYLRCRVAHLPFASPVDHPRPDRGALERQIADAILAMGHTMMLTVPVVLPRGHISMLTWVGPGTLAGTEAKVDLLRPELLAIGHLFMAAVAHEAGRSVVTPEELSELTPREWDCLRLVAQGYRDIQIAGLIAVAPTTVRFHLDNVVRKLGAANRTHAVGIAAQLGMLGSITA
ncbi:helix-turn-helix transcriptional regulator [Zavarzinia sp. CC-PAN008]|uniref:helix-turn-helix transcriptional regulator n=1 Tax=Zavarzinia sp. CC-PAN008 TaxID=3243332 RepID=UPI003F748902